ncbi:MAG TPA: hypothetical protein VFS26_08890 [Solirubrobacterales bacterium]|nr:hypothetical protein [Solirubrobacterales bacterium]
MKAEQINTTFRIASEAQRHQVLVDAVVTPELREAMRDHGKQISEALNLQVKVRDLISPSLEGLLLEQNKRIADMLDSAGMRKAFAGINFNLPDGWAEQVAAFRDQVVADAAAAEMNTDDTSSGIGRLAEDREAIIICLQRIGFAMEGFAYLPRSPIPPIVGYLLLMLAVIGQVADEKLSEREDDY